MAELLFVCRLIYNLSMHLCLSLLYDVVELWFYQCICGWVCYMMWLSYGLSMHSWLSLFYVLSELWFNLTSVAEFLLWCGWVCFMFGLSFCYVMAEFGLWFGWVMLSVAELFYVVAELIYAYGWFMVYQMSEDQARDYRPRLYLAGDSNLEAKAINQNIKMGDFPLIRESIGQDTWDQMKETPLGLIAKLVNSHFLWSGKIIHYLLYRQLRILKKEICCLVAGQPIRFGLNEFGHITQFNTDPLPREQFKHAVDYKTFFRELGVPTGEGLKLDEHRRGLVVCRAWPLEKRIWFGLHPNSRIPFESAKRVFDDETMKTYPWGRSAFETLVVSIKLPRPIGKSYTISGMAFVLQAWVYDSINTIGERFGNVVKEDEISLLRWGCNRTRTIIESAIAEDITNITTTASAQYIWVVL